MNIFKPIPLLLLALILQTQSFAHTFDDAEASEDEQEISYLKSVYAHGLQNAIQDIDEEGTPIEETLAGLVPEFFVYGLEVQPALGYSKVIKFKGGLKIEYHFRRVKRESSP
jgi:hypothetical protein